MTEKIYEKKANKQKTNKKQVSNKKTTFPFAFTLTGRCPTNETDWLLRTKQRKDVNYTRDSQNYVTAFTSHNALHFVVINAYFIHFFGQFGGF